MSAQLLSRLQQFMPPLKGEPIDLLLPLYIAIAVLFVRVASEALIIPPLNRVFKASSSANPAKVQKQAKNVFNNTFIALSSGLMTAWAWYVTLYENGGCTPLHPKACLADWPNIPVTHQFRLVWLTIFGFYLYEMIGTALRIGCVLSTEMVVHHVITMWMMLYGYFYSLHRYGLMATALLDCSNTLLHAAKALNYAVPAVPSLAPAKDMAFKAFALVFFVCRVLVPPFALIRPGLLYGRAMPWTSYYITNGLLLFIYSLQLFWFVKIVRIALGHDSGDDEKDAESRAARKAKATAAAAAGAHTTKVE
eukprot:GHRR01007884.1.p1 GENE.GHRR01007884.1~~GHRR01007884.1.p1  ORF type:complete len:307 (+),score=69.47 GHRR01007884.1:289-1209(+)